MKTVSLNLLPHYAEDVFFIAILFLGYIETFKQVTNKLCKNKSSPLPLFFANIEAMESISKNKVLLKKIFEAFDTRELGRYELYINKKGLMLANCIALSYCYPKPPTKPF